MISAKSAISVRASCTCLLLIALGVAAPTLARAVEPVRADQVSSITRAVFADGQLWLLSDAGELSTIRPDDHERTTQAFASPVLDLCVSARQPQVIIDGKDGAWEIHRREAQDWPLVTSIVKQGESLLAVACNAGKTHLLTSGRLIELGSDTSPHSVSLAGELPRGIVTAIHDEGTSVLVSINGGEWGGGLRRIDMTTGAVVTVEQEDDSGICSGPLNPSCDPVNGIAAVPWNARCVAVAVGLVHMLMEGRVVEVCGSKIRTLYAKPFTQPFWASLGKRKPPPETVAFFGIAESGGMLWAVGTDGLYRIETGGKATMLPLPAFTTIDGIDVSFDNPQLVFVMTSANQRHSLSGSVPMMVPRQ